MRTFALLAGLLAPGIASACDEAEKLRLAEEAANLAARNAWSGVERTYGALQATGCELGFEQHFLASEAARYIGMIHEQYERLLLARAVATAEQAEDLPRIEESLAAIDAAYGRVRIAGDARHPPVLTRADMPFAPDQRKAIERAQAVVAETGSFEGMLPLGPYTVGDVEFTSEVGPDFQVVTVGRVRGSDAVAGSRTGPTTSSRGALRYASVVATVGPGFVSSPESKEPVLLRDGGHAFAPSSVLLSGVTLQIGGEAGLGHGEPALGIAATLGYTGGFGTDTFNVFTGWFAGVIRPGDLRLALGPQFQMVLGSGTGVASWFDRGHDPRTDPNEQLRYSGLAWGPGVQGSVGYGLLDLDALRGIVDLGGSWQSDGARSYFTFGLRVGVVPAVPRFEG